MNDAAVTANTLRRHGADAGTAPAGNGGDGGNGFNTETRSNGDETATSNVTPSRGTTARGRGQRAAGPRLELDFDVRVGPDVDAVDEPDAVRVVLHDHRVGAGAVAEEADAAHQRAVGDAGRGENDVPAGREILGAVDALEVGDPHRAAARLVLGFADHQ